MTDHTDGARPARGVSPAEFSQLLEQPLAEAVLSIDMATWQRERLEALPEPNEARLAAAGEAIISAEARHASLRAAGRAGLSTIDDFPHEDILRAQMKLDRRPDAEADSLFADMAALNAYAHSDNPVILVVGQVSSSHEEKADPSSVYVNFLRLKVPEDDADEPAATIAPSGPGDEYRVRLAASETYTLYPVQGYNYKRLDHNGEPGLRSIVKPAEDLVFVSDSKALGELLYSDEFPHAALTSTDEPTATAVIYGDETVELFTRILGNAREELRPALYGTMKNLDKQYRGLGLSTEAEVKSAQDAFRVDLNGFVGDALFRRMRMMGYVTDTQHELLTPDVQRYIGISDDDFVALVENAFDLHAESRVQNKKAFVQCGTEGGVDRAWNFVWRSLAQDKGFTELSDKMRDPQTAASKVAGIQRRAFEKRLNQYSGTLPSKSERRRIRKALKDLDEYGDVAQ